MVQSWNNSDNLYLKFGPDKAVAGTAGELHTFGQMHQFLFKVTLANLTQTETILDDNVLIPSGYRIQSVNVVTETAAATGTAIDVGLARRITAGALTLTEVDYDGLLAAFPTSQMNSAGEQTTLSAITTVPATQTGTGAVIGTTLANPAYVSASMTDATAFTAGVIHITINAYRP